MILYLGPYPTEEEAQLHAKEGDIVEPSEGGRWWIILAKPLNPEEVE